MTNEEQQGIIKNLTIALDKVSSLAKTLRDERDEAREDATNYYAKIGELKQERDEARERIDRYREKNDLLPISWDQ